MKYDITDINTCDHSKLSKWYDTRFEQSSDNTLEETFVQLTWAWSQIIGIIIGSENNETSCLNKSTAKQTVQT